MEQPTLHMVTPAFLYPLEFFSAESLLLPLWYVYTYLILKPYDLLNTGAAKYWVIVVY